ncbi:MAG: hypothetical protein K2O02_02535 [Lachnospiraceae bacterium]|nr:hypothetical protein [Lachnospiraceae bacterium]
MDKAFDVILQSEVAATVIAKTSYYSDCDRFRCLYCGEEVDIAAADSNEKSPHFRHRRGNNDKDCEQYLGQPGAVEHYVSVRKNKQEHIEFYFNKERMTFEVSAAFSEEELRDYEQSKNRMDISAKFCAEPFLSVPINKGNFAPGENHYFILDTYSNDYCVSFSNSKKVYSDVIKKNGGLNIYKVRLQDERAKPQGTDLLYTGTTYIAISENENIIQELTGLENSVSVEDEFNFRAIGVDFYGITFSIKSADYSLKLFFKKNNYQIEISESLEILWPPVYTLDSDFVCNDDKIYVSSSFKLISHGNTNIDDSLIQKVDDNLSEISINDLTIIYEKNIDVSIKKSNVQSDVPIHIAPDTIYLSKYVVLDTCDYFLFDNDGCTRLIAGTTVYLSEKDKVIGYKNGHIKEIILGSPVEEEDSKKVIFDILQYHPQSEKYDPDEFIDVTPSEAVVSYLESCYRNGRINTVVKRYIKEGLI